MFPYQVLNMKISVNQGDTINGVNLGVNINKDYLAFVCHIFTFKIFLVTEGTQGEILSDICTNSV